MTSALYEWKQKKIIHWHNNSINIFTIKEEQLKFENFCIGHSFDYKIQQASSLTRTFYDIIPEIIEWIIYLFTVEFWILDCVIYIKYF